MRPSRRTRKARSQSDSIPVNQVTQDPQPKTGRLWFARRWVCSFLVIALLALIAMDVPGILARAMANRAASQLDNASAERWISIAKSVSWRHGEMELLSARLLRRQGRADELEQALQRAIRSGADSKLVSLERALAQAQSGSLDSVEPQLFDALRNGIGDSAEISDAYANGLTISSRFDQALKVLQAWQIDYPKDPRPAYRIGRIFEHKAVWDKAQEHYRQSISVSPTYYPARFRLGRVLMYDRQLDAAKDEFATCLSMDNPLAAQIQIASCLKAQASTNQAAELLREVLKNDDAKILASYAALEETPEHHEAARILGDLEFELGNNAEAVRWLEHALAFNDRDSSSRYSLAVTLREMGREEEAEEHFSRFQLVREALSRANVLRSRIQADSEDVDARFELGELLLTHESIRMGLFWLRSVLEIQPDHQGAHRTLAKHYSDLAVNAPEYKTLADFHRQQFRPVTP